jgi:hypothetical protein
MKSPALTSKVACAIIATVSKTSGGKTSRPSIGIARHSGTIPQAEYGIRVHSPNQSAQYSPQKVRPDY